MIEEPIKISPDLCPENVHKFQGFDIINDDVLGLITSYLTIYENYMLMFVFKDIKYKIVWQQNQANSFRCFEFININHCLALDSGIIPTIPYNKINHDNSITNYTKVPKTDALKLFSLKPEHLINLDFQLIKRYGGKHMYLFDIKDLHKKSAEVHFGITNLLLKQADKLRKADQRRQAHHEKQHLFNNWKADLIKQAYNLYSTMSNDERQIILDMELSKNSLIRRPDSNLCRDFIRFTVSMFVDEVVALIWCANELHKYSGVIYNEYSASLIQQMYMLKYKNKSISYIDAMKKVYTKRSNKIEQRYIDIEYYL